MKHNEVTSEQRLFNFFSMAVFIFRFSLDQKLEEDICAITMSELSQFLVETPLKLTLNLPLKKFHVFRKKDNRSKSGVFQFCLGFWANRISGDFPNMGKLANKILLAYQARKNLSFASLIYQKNWILLVYFFSENKQSKFTFVQNIWINSNLLLS